MCVYIAIIAIFLAVTLWRVDRAAAIKCNGYRLESSLAGHLDKCCVQCTMECNRMQTWNASASGSDHREGLCSVGKHTLGCRFILIYQ